MHFLVVIDIAEPPPGVKASLIEAERRRARELADAGHLLKLWRLTGRWANAGIWHAADEAALESILSSMPLWPWMTAAVERLSPHPNDPLPEILA